MGKAPPGCWGPEVLGTASEVAVGLGDSVAGGTVAVGLAVGGIGVCAGVRTGGGGNRVGVGVGWHCVGVGVGVRGGAGPCATSMMVSVSHSHVLAPDTNASGTMSAPSPIAAVVIDATHRARSAGIQG